MVLAEVSPSGDGGVAAGAETEVARIFEILEAKRGGKSLVTPFGDEQLAVVAEAMVGDATSAANLQENMLGDASSVDVVSPYFARAIGRDTLPPILQYILRAWWLGAALAGGTLQVARSASAPAGRVASAPAAEEESALTEAQVAELAKQNLTSIYEHLTYLYLTSIYEHDLEWSPSYRQAHSVGVQRRTPHASKAEVWANDMLAVGGFHYYHEKVDCDPGVCCQPCHQGPRRS